MGDIVSGLFSGFSTFFGAMANDWLNDKEQDRRWEDMEVQQMYNQKNFDYVAEYNEPINQRVRNLEAGINPNWSDAGQMAQPMHSITQPQGYDISAAMNAMSSMMNSMANLKNAETNEKVGNTQEFKNRAEGGKAMAEANLADTQSQGLDIENANKQQVYDDKHAEVEQAIQTNKAYENYLKVNADYQEAIKDPTVQKLQAEYFEALSRGNLEVAQAKSEEMLRNPRIRNLDAQTQEFLANAFKAKQDVAIAWEQVKLGKMQLNENARHNLAIEKLAQDQLSIEKPVKEALASLYREQGKEVHANWVKSCFITSLMEEGYRNGFFLVAYKTYSTLLSQEQAMLDRMIIENKMLSFEESMQLFDKVFSTYNEFVRTNSQALQSVGIGSMALPRVAPGVNIAPGQTGNSVIIPGVPTN